MGLWYSPSPQPFRPHDPSWRQPLFLHYRPLRRALAPALAALQGRVLDVGCGLSPYRAMLGPAVTAYVGVDRPGPFAQPDVSGDAEHLPFADAAFDAVVSTQVLEHVAHPARALGEAARVLLPGGALVLTVPGVWPTHEAPHDYWRFTRHGLLALLSDAGFERVTLAPLGGLWSTVGQLACLELASGPRLARELIPAVNLAAAWLDRRGAREDLALAWLACGTRRR